MRLLQVSKDEFDAAISRLTLEELRELCWAMMSILNQTEVKDTPEILTMTNKRDNPHPYEWKGTWESIAEELTKKDILKTFRKNTTLTKRVIGHDLPRFLKCCKEARIPNEWLTDTLIGGPAARKVDSKTLEILKKGREERQSSTAFWVTATSLRAGYFLHRIHENWNIYKPNKIKVLEVGAGFGCFAGLICRTIPIETYYLIDASPMLEMQKYYMQEAGFIDICEFLTPDEAPDEKVDLIISTMSLGEMPMKEVKKYLALFSQVLSSDGLLYLVQRTTGARIPWDSFNFGPEWELEVDQFKPLGHFMECFGRLK